MTRILQDRRGFIWVGTQIGLNRYDGQNFKVYKNEPWVKQTLSSNAISALCEDDEGIFWIGTTNGLDRFDPEQERYENFLKGEAGKSASVLSLAFQQEVGLWVGTDQGLFLMNTRTRELKRIGESATPPAQARGNANASVAGVPASPQEAPGFSTGLEILALLPDGPDRLWAGTTTGLICWNKQGLFQIPFPEGAEPSAVKSLARARNGAIWIGTQNHGLYCLDPAKRSWRHFQNEQNNQESLGQDTINALLFDSDDQLWIGTEFGLDRMDPDRDGFRHYRNNPIDPNSLGNNSIFSLYQSKEGVLWVGTSSGGLHRLNPSGLNFEIQRPDPGMLEGAIGKLIWGLYPDQNGSLWVGTQDAGLARLNLATGRYSHYESTKGDPNSLASHRLYAITNAEPGFLWLGTDTGLRRFEIRSGRSQPVARSRTSGEPIGEKPVRAFYRDRKGTFWVGTERGLFRKNGEAFELFAAANAAPLQLSHSRVFSLLEDQEGALWVGTLKGINRIDPARKAVSIYLHDPSDTQSLSQNVVLALHQDQKGRIWAGTDSGLNLFDPKSKHFKSYGVADGMPNEVIYAILEDGRGYLWLSTNNGISLFQPEQEHFRNYDAQNGLHGNEFNHASACKLPDGRLCMGGIGGFTIFDPKRLNGHAVAPITQISDLLLFNSSVPLQSQSEKSPLSRNIFATKELNLSYRDLVVTFEFAALHYAHPEGNRFSYRLEGYDDRWTETDVGKRFATYTRLPAGTYRLRVKSASPDGIWDEEGASLWVHMYPPFWKSKAAYAFYIICLFVLLVGFPFWRIRRLEKYRNELELQVSAKTRSLSDKNHELEALDEMVRNINSEFELEVLLQALLDQGVKLVPNAEKGLIFLLKRDNSLYRIVATVGYPMERLKSLRLTPEQANLYLTKASDELDPGIFGPQICGEALASFLQFEQKPPSALLSMALDWKGRNVGFLMFTSFSQTGAFGKREIDRLRRFRQHAVSAVAKTTMLRDLRDTTRQLQEAQEQLIEAAHRSGMSEIVTNVMHNVGNLLNTVQTSSDCLREQIVQEKPVNMLARIAALLEAEAKNIVQFMTENPRGKHLPQALTKLAKEFGRRQESQHKEVRYICEKLEEMRIILRAQEQYASGTFFVEEVNLAQLIGHVAVLQKESLHLEAVELVTDLDKVPSVKAHKAKLMQVILHLVINAAEALRVEVGAQKTICLRLRDQEEWVRLEIQDNGPGISLVDKDCIFRSGFSTKPKGNGLGLHFCANAMTEMKGKIELTSLQGQGACFVLLLPKEMV